MKPGRPGVRSAAWRHNGSGSDGGQIPIAPSPRVAAAPRPPQTRWVVAAVAVVLLGGLVLLYAVPLYAGRSPVLVLARDVTAGATLTDADLTTADVSVGEQVPVVRRQEEVVGKTALADLPAGSVLSPRLVGQASAVTSGQVLVPVRAKPGQRPQQGLRFGAQVLAVPAPADPSSAGAQALAAVAPIRATVVSVGEPEAATGDVVVDVRVPDKDAVGLARAAATGSLTLLVLPAGGGQ